MAARRPLPRGVVQSNSGSFEVVFVSRESFVEEFEDLFLFLLIRVSIHSAIKSLKIAWPRRTVYQGCYSSASRISPISSLQYLKNDLVDDLKKNISVSQLL